MRLPIRSIPSDEMLGHRGRDLVEAGKSLHFAKPILQNPYDPEKNPNGFVNIGVSENVCLDV